jgi:hypothetical protein
MKNLKPLRKRRGALNFISEISKILFGTLDEDLRIVGGGSPNWVHSAPRPFTVLLCLPRVIVRMENYSVEYSSVGIATGYGLDDQWRQEFGSRYGKKFSLLHIVRGTR